MISLQRAVEDYTYQLAALSLLLKEKEHSLLPPANSTGISLAMFYSPASPYVCVCVCVCVCVSIDIASPWAAPSNLRLNASPSRTLNLVGVNPQVSPLLFMFFDYAFRLLISWLGRMIRMMSRKR